MRARRSVEELSTGDLERILRERKRAERLARLNKFRRSGRAVTLPVIEHKPVIARTDDFRSELSRDEGFEPDKRRRSRTWLDRALLALEIAAVTGLVYLIYTGAGLLGRLNTEVAQAIAQPTLTPTPIIRAVVLPSGHTPPTAPGGARPNEAEVPENLRSLAQALPPLIIPTSSPQQALRLEIPELEALREGAPIVQGDAWEQLKKGVGQHVGSADPGQRGNLVLSAHNDIFGELFRDLDRLQPGDEIRIYTLSQAFTYIVTGTRIVEPAEVNVMAPTSSATITLVSCYPYLVDKKRIVVFGELKES